MKEKPAITNRQIPKIFGKTRKFLWWVLTFSITSAVICLIIGWVWITILEDTWTPWQSLGHPPDKAVRIVGLGWDNKYRRGTHPSAVLVYVETVDGTIYRCCDNEEIIWTMTTEKGFTEWEWDCGLTPSVKPLKETVDTTVLSWCGEAHSGMVSYAVLNDGSVWKWTHNRSILAYDLLICMSPLLGIIFGTLITKILASKEKA